ncbi:MAG TPA: alpha/beta hydrolase [Verrucomicrobiae bacterium]|nr:alpha/beta hydrolase [Verrucomicrobiae bacterium]
MAEPDNEYRDPSGNRVIPCARDLEDFARLWILGLGTNLLADMPSDWQITLNWGDVGAPDMNNPAIDLFVAQDFDGGIAYLTNAADAQVQTIAAYNPWLGQLGPGQQIHLRGAQFTNGWAGNYFIWCGAKAGTGKLTLTVANGNGDTVAQTTACIQIRDIKQMYERWTVGDQPGVSPATNAVPAAEDLPPFTPAFQYGLSASTNTPYILYVHGWNMNRYDKDRFAESAFKRLYWQGYQGRFGVFRWPTDYGFSGDIFGSWSNPLTDPHNYDNSEFYAWRSAQGLLNKLEDLNTEYPGHVYLLAHSMGNVVAGNALRLAGNDQIVNTYIASQAAIPAHVYNGANTNLIDFTHTNPKIPSWLTRSSWGPDTPNIYGDRLAGNSASVGRRINYYNVNDYALSPDAWCFNQEWKPDNFFGGYYNYTGSTNDPAPWNHFEFVPIGESPLALDIVNNQQDLYEAFSYAAESRSKALGATPNVANLTQTLNLTTVWPTDSSGHNYSDHFYHSAEFRGDCWQEWNYWNTLLFSSQYGFNIGN